jgi:hypothetical protein
MYAAMLVHQLFKMGQFLFVGNNSEYLSRGMMLVGLPPNSLDDGGPLGCLDVLQLKVSAL